MFAPALEPYRGSGSDWILDAYLAELVDVRPRFEEAEVLVAEHHGRVVGTITFYADVRHEGWSNLPAGWAGFRALAVPPRIRGAGIGKALVQHCIERTRNAGAETLGIHTIALLTDAVSSTSGSDSFAVPSSTCGQPTSSPPKTQTKWSGSPSATTSNAHVPPVKAVPIARKHGPTSTSSRTWLSRC